MTPTNTSTCRHCGGAVLPGDRFCGGCGTPVSGVTPAVTPAAPHPDASAHAPATSGERSPWTAVVARLQAATIGEFEILAELGRGGMAAVYLARDLALSRRVAIKVMAPGLLLGPGMVERFRQEAITVANLQHAHIVAIHAVRQLADLHFFVMQFVPGKSLEGVLREKEALPLAVVRAWLYQVGSALGYAHRRGVIHRDIKPGNILLNADGEAIVTDFGIAKVAESPSHTQTGTVVGTPVYMSPEQCYARELTGASDQYSLGVVAFEMLAGQTPFTGSSFALMRAHTDDPPPPIRSLREDIPASVEAALARMLAKRPEDRFTHLGEALVALGAAPIAPDDPIHATLQDYAGAAERLHALGDVLTTPASPIPKTRARPDPVTPRSPVPVPPALVVVMAPPPTDLEPGATAPLRATVKNAAGQAVPGTDLRWSSSEPSVVTVDGATGLLTAVATGKATITATAGGAHDSIDVTVGEPKPAHITVTISRDVLEPGDRAALSAVVTSRFGVRIDRDVRWGVDAPSVARIEPQPGSMTGTALLRAIAPGSVGVVATCDGASGRSGVRVSAPVVAPPVAPPLIRVAPPSTDRPESAPHRVEPAAGSSAPAASAAATSLPPASTPATATPAAPTPAAPPPAPVPSGSRPPRPDQSPPPVLSATAVMPPVERPPDVAPDQSERTRARAVAPTVREPVAATPAVGSAAGGATPIVVERSSGKGRAWWWWAIPTVAVVGGVVAYFELRPTPTPDGDSSVVRPPNPILAGVDSTAQSNPLGTSASSSAAPPRDSTDATPTDSATTRDSVAAPVPPPVSPPPSAVARRIDLRPARPDAIRPGESVVLAATVHDASGTRMPDARVTWSSADPRVVTVDPARGVVRAVSAGTTRVTARVGNVRSSVAMTVVPPPADPAIVESVEIGDIRPLTVGETSRLSARALNAAGASAPGAVIDWSSSSPEIASVSSEGVVAARAAGTAIIRASAGGRNAARSVTVRAREIATRIDSPVTRPPPAKTEAELRNEILGVLATYARAIQSRDTSLIRRVFPTVADAFLTRWQQTFKEATGPIQVTTGTIQVLDVPRDVAGAQVRATYAGRLEFRVGRSDQGGPYTFTATLQREGGTWKITTLR
jgi:serine/threonine-protein kinase